MKRTRLIATGIIISLFVFTSAVFAASESSSSVVTQTPTETTVIIKTIATGAVKDAVQTETTTTTKQQIPVSQESAALVTDQQRTGGGWILILMIVLPLAIGFAIGWFVNGKIQAKKAEAFAAEDMEDEEDVPQYEKPEAPYSAPSVQRQETQKVEARVNSGQKMPTNDRTVMKPMPEVIIKHPQPVVHVTPVAPPSPVIHDVISGQIDDWGNPYYYDDQGIPYFYDPETDVRTYYETDDSQT